MMGGSVQFDYREKIIELSEACLQNFAKIRIKNLGLEKVWQHDVASLVRTNYQENSVSYHKIYTFLLSHDEEELNIEQLDVTAIVPLFLYSDKYAIGEMMSFDSLQIKRAFKDHIRNIKNGRNAIDHYPQICPDSEKINLLYDQLNALFCIAAFATIAQR